MCNDLRVIIVSNAVRAVWFSSTERWYMKGSGPTSLGAPTYREPPNADDIVVSVDCDVVSVWWFPEGWSSQRRWEVDGVLSIFEPAGVSKYGHLPCCKIPDGVVENDGHSYNLMWNSERTVREYVQYKNFDKIIA